MPDKNPSIEDLFKKKNSQADLPGSKTYQAQKTLSEVNRAFEEKQTALKAKELGYPYVNLHGFPLDLEALALVSEEEAQEYGIIPFHHESGLIRLGIVNPVEAKWQVVSKKLTQEKYEVQPFVISPNSFAEALPSFARVVRAAKAVSEQIELKSSELKNRAETVKQILVNSLPKLVRMDASDLLADIMSIGLDQQGSDIHLEPEEHHVVLRVRIDGVLHDVVNIPREIYPKILSRIKIVSHLKLNVRTNSQDGSFNLHLDGQEVDIRVSILPAIYGESVVMRILRQQKTLTLDDLGISGLARTRLEEALQKTTGMILTTGPTGSGKTTTLYALLTRLNKRGTKIITIEDPIEYRVEGISQTPIDKAAGVSFASALRSILRQDPDIVMVGEIRDHETADVATQAALTGHVVFSTLHTNDAVGTLARLSDLEIKPFIVVSSINIVMAQRLVRRLCTYCKTEDKPDEKLLARVKNTLTVLPKNSGVEVPKDLKFYKSPGCEHCGGLGYKGQIGIFELLVITPEMEKLILRESPLSALRQQAIEDGMATMAQDGLLKALDGITDIYEVFRVTD